MTNYIGGEIYHSCNIKALGRYIQSNSVEK